MSQPAGLESQRPPAEPVRVHSTPVPNTVGHDMVGQVLGLGQLTSQAHDIAQSTDAQACDEQLIEHSPGPQLMLWHAAAPWHSMVDRRLRGPA